MLTVHHLGISQSERIVWLCEELGIDYKLVVHDRDAETRLAPDAYRALHPLGTAPIIHDGIHDGEVKLAESGAIMEYIIHKYGDGRLWAKPTDPHYADFLFWFHFGNGSLMPARMIDMIMGMMGEAGEAGAALFKQRSDRIYTMMNERLADNDYLAGSEFTAADIICFFQLTTMAAFAPLDLSPYPHIQAYIKRVAARPAYRAAMKKGDPNLPLPG